jgi:hypothetical protein
MAMKIWCNGNGYGCVLADGDDGRAMALGRSSSRDKIKNGDALSHDVSMVSDLLFGVLGFWQMKEVFCSLAPAPAPDH